LCLPERAGKRAPARKQRREKRPRDNEKEKIEQSSSRWRLLFFFFGQIPHPPLLDSACRTDLVEFILDLRAAADLDDRVDDLRARGAALKID
jgi:hypothetical protein